MIVRGALKCKVCGHFHVIRIGMGQEEKQRHKFRCRRCRELIEVGLDVDYKKIAHRIYFGENAEPVEETGKAADVVNLDANFPIPAKLQGRDRVFPRLEMQKRIIDKVISRRRKKRLPDLPESGSVSFEDYQRPDHAAEWNELRRVWNWIEQDDIDLAEEAIARAQQDRYSRDPLTGEDQKQKANDWLWRLLTKIVEPEFNEPFEEAMRVINSVDRDELKRFYEEYYENSITERSEIYNRIIAEFFRSYDEFSQILLFVKNGIDVDFDVESTSDFVSVSMFYGNAFEALGSLVDFLALINNAANGRKFEEFERLTLDKYLSLDKSAKFGPFKNNGQFRLFSSETDNGLRNASHHGRLKYVTRGNRIEFRRGNAGKGDWERIGYGTYLERCSRMFCIVVTLLRVELVFCQVLGKKNVIHPKSIVS